MKKFFLFAILSVISLCAAAQGTEGNYQVIPFSIDKGVDVGSPKSIYLYLTGTEKCTGGSLFVYLPDVLEYKSATRNSDLFPKDDEEEWLHNLSCTKVASDKPGFIKLSVVFFNMDKELLKKASGKLMTIKVGSSATGTDGVYPIYVTEAKAANADNVNIVNVKGNSCSYVVYGTPSEKVINVDGVVGSQVISALPADATIDLSAATAIYGTSTNAVNAKYTRTVGNEWNTVCLPYAVKSTENVKYYTIKNINSDNIEVSYVSELTAGTPALVNVTGGSLVADANNVTINTAITNGTMIGTFEPINVTADDTYYIKENKFWKINKNFNVAAFKAYIDAGSGAKESVLDIVEATTAIKAANAANGIEEVYDINGARKNNVQNGLNIVKMSDGRVMKVVVK